MPVVNKQTLGIAVIPAGNRSPVIRLRFRDGEGELAARASGAIKDVDEAVAGFLAGDAGPDHGDDVGEGEDRFEDDGTDGVDHHDGVLVYSCDGGNERVAAVPRVEVVSVAGVAFDLRVLDVGLGSATFLP